ncbi:MAG: hypothetical protein SFT81_07980 [Candidatus Caenarcaniphilales bacterium]|nr:hypothetical protein [Candidatus Caenarcaniphilales bacterium]
MSALIIATFIIMALVSPSSVAIDYRPDISPPVQPTNCIYVLNRSNYNQSVLNGEAYNMRPFLSQCMGKKLLIEAGNIIYFDRNKPFLEGFYNSGCEYLGPVGLQYTSYRICGNINAVPMNVTAFAL